jgi:hypothetical protein
MKGPYLATVLSSNISGTNPVEAGTIRYSIVSKDPISPMLYEDVEVQHQVDSDMFVYPARVGSPAFIWFDSNGIVRFSVIDERISWSSCQTIGDPGGPDIVIEPVGGEGSGVEPGGVS